MRQHAYRWKSAAASCRAAVNGLILGSLIAALPRFAALADTADTHPSEPTAEEMYAKERARERRSEFAELGSMLDMWTDRAASAA